METNKIRRFATEARAILLRGVAQRLGALGFGPDGKAQEEPQLYDGGCRFRGEVFSEEFYRRWQSLAANVRRRGMRATQEQAAYTWFNRLTALYIMSRQGFAAPALAWESDGSRVPGLVAEARAGRIPPMSTRRRQQLDDLLGDDAQTDAQFRLLITACLHATPVLERCFGRIADWTELLLPQNILAEGGFVDMLNTTTALTDDDCRSPQLIGWLYQFYIVERKAEATAKKGRYAQDDLAPATQIFTPQWIVRYMVDNTLAPIYRQYAGTAEKARYEVEAADGATPCPDIASLEELACADFACGSGHILVEMFATLYAMYLSEGYASAEAVRLILSRNIIGLDLDPRARQLAQFALLMAAARRDDSVLDAHLMPRIYDMPEPYGESDETLRYHLRQYIMGDDSGVLDEAAAALRLMDQAETLGSAMRFALSERTRNILAVRTAEYDAQDNPPAIAVRLLPYMHIVLALTDRYAAVCMNPPYLGSGHYTEGLRQYVAANYPEAKADLCTVFMDVAIERLMPRGKYAMINMHSWMFLTSFETLRRRVLKEQHIDSMLHLGPRTFDELSGEVVQNTAFVISNTAPDTKGGTYFRLVGGKDCADKERLFLTEPTTRYDNVPQSNFEKIPGSPIGYWVSEKMIKCFEEEKHLYDYSDSKQGLITGNNDRFLRYLWEVSKYDINSGWFLYSKGGSFRRWYGNIEYCVNWKDNGLDIKSCKDANGKLLSRPQNEGFYFAKNGLTWSAIGSFKPSFRLFHKEWLFDAKGSVCFPKTEDEIELLAGYLNSNVADYFYSSFSVTLDYSVGPLSKLPYKSISNNHLNSLVRRNISISRSDWDAHETSWDFKENELVRIYKAMGGGEPLDGVLAEYKREWGQLFAELHSNEEELNRQFISIYGLEDELAPDVPLEEVTILQQGEVSIEDGRTVWHDDVVVRQLLSYAVGCIMGRYRLDRPGLAIAHPSPTEAELAAYEAGGTRFDIDDDGIVPLMAGESEFQDNATARVKAWLAAAFGGDNLAGNLNFVERALGKPLDDYLACDFWDDHKRRYQNRPIYWLFTSKRKGRRTPAFQCLAYLHRMDAYTPERIRTRYLLPHIEWLASREADLQRRAADLTDMERQQLDTVRRQIEECREYHSRLHTLADKQTALDLDDGVVANYAKMGDVVAKIK